MWNVRCRHHACRHRRHSTVHPDEAQLTVTCPKCGSTKGWRVEGQYKDKREICRCESVVGKDGRTYPHYTYHKYCENGPYGPYNIAKRQGADDRDIPVEFLPPEVRARIEAEDKDPEFCPF